MVRRALVPAVFAASLLAGCSSAVPAQPVSMDCVPAVIGHRGSPASAPEETLASFRTAIDDGARIIEGDVRFTKDGHPVMLHDPTLDRTTNGKGPVADKTLAQVEALDAGAWKGKEWKGTRVPTLQQFLELASTDHVQVIVELSAPNASRAQLQAFLDQLDQTGMTQRALIESFHLGNLEQVRLLDPSVRTGLITALPGEQVDLAGLDNGVLPRISLVTPARVKAWHAAGLEVYSWTADTPEQWVKARESGVDGVMTNRVADYEKWAKQECGRS